MFFNRYRNIKDNFAKENVLLKTVIVILVVLIMYLIYIVVSRTDSQRTVFLPPQSTYKEFWISGDEVSKSYLETVGSFIAYNLLNVSKDNAKLLLSNILPLVDSNTYYEVKQELQKMHNYIVSNQMSRTFYLGEVEQTGNSQMIVSGTLRDSISTKIIKTEQVRLVIDYKIKFGLFHIVNLTLEDK